MPSSETIKTESVSAKTKVAHPIFSLALKMTLSIASLMSLALVLVWFLISYNIEILLEKQAAEFGESFAQQAADSAAELILAEDTLALNVLTNNLVRDSHITEAVIYAKDGTRLAHAPKELEEDNTQQSAKLILPSENENPLTNTTGEQIPFIVTVKFKDLNVGFVKVLLTRDKLEKAIHSSMRKISIATIVIIAFSIAAAFFLGRLLARPVNELLAAAQLLANNASQKIAHKRSDEIGQLIKTINDMAVGLEENSAKVNTLSRLVSPAVMNELTDKSSADIKSQHVKATVLFIDLVGFTSLSEKLHPQRVADLLNRYFSLINRVAKLYNGNVDKYIGDCAMIVFGAPQHDDEHCFHALCCARLFNQVVQHYNSELPENETRVSFRFGIHTGDMIAGLMGSADRMHFTVIGDSVNLASRLATIGEPDQVVISEAVLNERDMKSRIIVEDFQEILLKGKSVPTKSYRMIGMKNTYAQLIERQVQHMLKESLSA